MLGVVQAVLGATVRGLVLGAVLVAALSGVPRAVEVLFRMKLQVLWWCWVPNLPPAGCCRVLLVKFRPEGSKAETVFSLPATLTLVQGSGP